MDPLIQKNNEILVKLGIEFTSIEHPPFKEIFDCMRHLGLPISEGFSTLVMKADDQYVAIIRRDDCQLDLDRACQLIGCKKLSLASPSEFEALTHTPSGAAFVVNPVTATYLDQKLFEKEFLMGGSGSLSITNRYRSADLKKIPGSKVVDIATLKARKRILTGDTPSGRLHLGHYVGTLENRVRLQDEYETFILLANVHAYANNYRDSETINKNVYEVFLDNLAVGIDPNKSTIYLESGIPETMELYSYFLTMVTHARALRNPSVKEEIKYKKIDPSIGFIVYPVLQAADILGFNANLVPVGEDQSPVIEQTREIARDFNKAFGTTFNIPDAMIGRVPRLVGTDGLTKMSKSGGNAILLSDDEATLKKKIQACYTDPQRVHATDPGRVEGNPVFEYHRAFNPNKEEVADLEARYLVGKVGDKEVKDKLFIALNTFLEPIRAKRKYYEDNPDIAKQILIEGTKRARTIVASVTSEVREKMAFNKLLS
ncbi:MAG: tryptophan--tRNA ligase [Candidatus Shapirobacteria bacterium]|jgi:tryptophanyl-tRNA synthetase